MDRCVLRTLTRPDTVGEALIDQALEREVKLAVPDLGPITARLHALEADDTSALRTVHLQTVHEDNTILDTPQGDLKARDERLRLRRIRGRPGVLVTWKGPGQVRHGVRRRPEREVHAADASACAAIFAALGFHPMRSYEKVRSSWQLGDLIVCLDQLPFGAFVEIEFTDAVSVDDEPLVLQRAIALLGLENAPRVHASYARLQQEWDSRKKRP